MKNQLLSQLVVSVALAIAAASAQADDKIIVGQSAPLTGANATIGKDIQLGARAWFDKVNAAGGINGRKIEFVTLDDANKRETAGQNAKKLIEEQKAVALFGFASATLSLDAAPQAEQAGVPFFAPFSGAETLKKLGPYVFTVRANYADELEKILSFWSTFGVTKTAVVHYDDEVGKQNFATVASYLERLGDKPVSVAIKRNEALPASAKEALVKTAPQLVVNTTLFAPAAELMKQMQATNKSFLWASISFAGTDQLIKAAGPAAAGMAVTQVVPDPSSPAPIVRECDKLVKASGATSMNSTQLEGCIAAKVLTEGMRRAGKVVTRASLYDALRNLGTYDAGGFVVRFAPGAHHGSRFVDLSVVDKEGKVKS